jgi:hypothetical protein
MTERDYSVRSAPIPGGPRRLTIEAAPVTSSPGSIGFAQDLRNQHHRIRIVVHTGDRDAGRCPHPRDLLRDERELESGLGSRDVGHQHRQPGAELHQLWAPGCRSFGGHA